MIERKAQVFYIQMRRSSYWFEFSPQGHLRHIYYGPLLPLQEPEPLRLKHSVALGGSILTHPEQENYCLDHECLEYSAFGRGDYRESPVELRFEDGSFNLEFRYEGYALFAGEELRETDLAGAPLRVPRPAEDGYPQPDCRGSETLLVRLREACRGVVLELIFRVYAEFDVIVRQTRLRNESGQSCRILKLMSLCFDLPNRDFELLTLHGLWGSEARPVRQPLYCGSYVNASQVGTSSNQHNPAFMLSEGRADGGYAYGFNLIYSSNHYSSVSLHPLNLCRVMLGLHPQRFSCLLEPGEPFATPEALQTFSDAGENGASQNFHRFINARLMPENVRFRPRPITYNHWEATFFNYSEASLLRLAKRAKALGCEAFMLDDGWFGRRDDDRSSLGDYAVNHKKFKNGLGPFFARLAAMGLEPGIWVEPEMISEDSDLFRAHPEYVLREPGREPCTGRHQLVLDLCQKEVRDYIVEQLSALLDSAPIRWVKWDMNRYLSDAYSPALADQGEVYHRYCLGLYEILRRVFEPRPAVRLEMCSSGGNRFDLGMLCFAGQIWVSDDTDPIERLKIQEGLSYFYPPAALSNHVSASPHQATLRQSPLSTRFNVATFGVLGYELDLELLTPVEKREIREQIAFYKNQRELLQFGRFSRLPQKKANKVCWQMLADPEFSGSGSAENTTTHSAAGMLKRACDERETAVPAVGIHSADAAARNAGADKDANPAGTNASAEPAAASAVVGYFQTLATAVEPFDRLHCYGLEAERFYELRTKAQSLMLERFGELVKFVLPVKLNPHGIIFQQINKRRVLPDACEHYRCSGRMLAQGIYLNNQFMGSGTNEQVRMLGDFGSNLYLITEATDTRADAPPPAEAEKEESHDGI